MADTVHLGSRLLPWLGLAALAGALTLALLRGRAPDPVADLRARAAPLSRVERAPAPELGPRVECWRLIDSRGETVRAIWRPAPAGTPRPWTAVMLGGLHTGDRASLLLPEDAPVHALAVDWPWPGPRRLSLLQFIARIPAIRASVLRAPAALALGAGAVALQPETDPGRVVLVGASLGAFPAVAAVRLTDQPDALVLIDGAADLPRVLRSELGRVLGSDLLAAPLGTLASGLIRPLEPELHAGAAARLPTLLVNAEDEERFPRAAIDRLHAALPGARVLWRRGTHLRAQRSEEIAALATEVAAWLDTLPR